MSAPVNLNINNIPNNVFYHFLITKNFSKIKCIQWGCEQQMETLNLFSKTNIPPHWTFLQHLQKAGAGSLRCCFASTKDMSQWLPANPSYAVSTVKFRVSGSAAWALKRLFFWFIFSIASLSVLTSWTWMEPDNEAGISPYMKVFDFPVISMHIFVDSL